MAINQEVSLLDYKGTINKNVDWSTNENKSGIYLKGFKINAEEMAQVTAGNVKVIKEDNDNDFEFTVEDIIQYKAWNYGKMTPGAGQLGIYKVKDKKGNTRFVLVKDYRAYEGDWRIMLLFMTETENEMKGELMMDSLGMTFMDYLFPQKT